MTRQRLWRTGGKFRLDGTAHNIGAATLRRGDHQIEPLRISDFVVVDHQEIERRRKSLSRFEKGPVDRMAIALLFFDKRESVKTVRFKERRRDR